MADTPNPWTLTGATCAPEERSIVNHLRKWLRHRLYRLSQRLEDLADNMRIKHEKRQPPKPQESRSWSLKVREDGSAVWRDGHKMYEVGRQSRIPMLPLIPEGVESAWLSCTVTNDGPPVFSIKYEVPSAPLTPGEGDPGDIAVMAHLGVKDWKAPEAAPADEGRICEAHFYDSIGGPEVPFGEGER